MKSLITELKISGYEFRNLLKSYCVVPEHSSVDIPNQDDYHLVITYSMDARVYTFKWILKSQEQIQNEKRIKRKEDIK